MHHSFNCWKRLKSPYTPLYPSLAQDGNANVLQSFISLTGAQRRLRAEDSRGIPGSGGQVRGCRQVVDRSPLLVEAASRGSVEARAEGGHGGGERWLLVRRDAAFSIAQRRYPR